MNFVAQSLKGNREQIAHQLLVQSHHSPNQQWLAKIIASWLIGQSVLPDYLGLEPSHFYAMHSIFFSDVDLPAIAPSCITLDYSRIPEKDDLVQLLQGFSRQNDQETNWMINMTVTACLGLDHLWHDLGLWHRSELTALLSYNFPLLAQNNTKDMKWKKFIYKKLCEAEGIYLCRAPSCEVCTDYAKCYGPED